MNPAIKSITAQPAWKEVEAVLQYKIEELLDVRNLKQNELASSRAECANALIKFLKEVKMLSTEEFKLNPKNFR